MSTRTTPEVTPGWVPWHPNPSKPTFVPPAGTVDAHCHVFGPAARFPFAPERKYTPVDGTKEQLFALRDHLGLARNVIVQATCHGKDNSALVDALQASNGLARGVATVDAEASYEELERLHAAGVRGVRFNFVKRLVDTVPTRALEIIADKIAPLGWHVVVYFEAPDLPELKEFFLSLPVPLVVDHMGRPDVTKAPDGPEFADFLDFAVQSEAWVKVSCPERLSKTGPRALDGEQCAYTDVVPFSRRAVETLPDKVLWGTDWPHPNLTDHMPDDGLLLDYVAQITGTSAQQQALLVDNPMRLYWPDESA